MDLPAGNRTILYRVRFAQEAQAGETQLLSFDDPCPCKAFFTEAPVEGPPAPPPAPKAGELLVLAKARDAKEDPQWGKEARAWLEGAGLCDGAHSISVKAGDGLVCWRPGQATLQAPAERIAALLGGLAEFAFLEGELRKIEREIACTWPELEIDLPLAYNVTAADLEQEASIGERMKGVLQRRVRHARIEPRLLQPATNLPAPAQQLGERLREEALIEDRLETIDSQIEVYEYIYEVAGQRMSDYRHARQSSRLEVTIIVLLVVEVALILAEWYWFWWNSPD
jgi:hypothetical protein